MNSFLKGLISGVIIVSSFYLLYFALFQSEGSAKVNHDAKNKIIIVDKQNQKLTIYDAFFGPIKTFDVSTGENVGNKSMKGDLKTPEGIFPVIGIEDASDWTYDFNDGNGETPGAYGPLFIRLKVDSHTIFKNGSTNIEYTSGNEFTGIGLHGTHLNNLIGSRASHGCIRLRNEDLIEVKKYIEPGTLVAIIPGKIDMEENLKSKNIN
jgi:lipoprotein-anchoring transpeptidase ErfK/SrfK